ncbi:MAG: UDP-3-O-(3-hydroxymyristoyl)glucosamine N-acyltransferase [Gemmataceae bacterium]|nr:UDP-3-O-(3-hydroxymyristoyl)glucosamine N-acyltransferase [Gemmataceae bacterium]
MTVTVRQLAELVNGQLHGDPDLAIANARPLGEAGPGDISFIENDKHAAQLKQCRASALVVPATLTPPGVTAIGVADPLGAFIAIVRHLHGRAEPSIHGIDPRASVHPSVQIGPGASVHPFVSIGESTVIGARCRLYPGCVIGSHCRLGDDVIVYPNAVFYEGTIIGDRVIIHANAVLGADGFGYRIQGGKHVKVPQLGHVEIGNDVEIGACSTIDRGTFQATRVGDGTKIDNLVMVGHNCQIGRHNLFVSQMGIAGSSSTGDYVIVAGQVGIVDHVHIGDRSVIGAGSGVPRDIAADQQVLGAPARPIREQKRILISMEKLPDLVRDVRRIKAKLGIVDEVAPGPEKAAG